MSDTAVESAAADQPADTYFCPACGRRFPGPGTDATGHAPVELVELASATGAETAQETPTAAEAPVEAPVEAEADTEAAGAAPAEQEAPALSPLEQARAALNAAGDAIAAAAGAITQHLNG